MVPEKLDGSVWFKGASKKLRSLEPVFAKLKDIHQDFISGKGDDWPYWYRERSQVGFLAAAFWQCGGAALEEYRWHKRKKGSREEFLGRCDLWGRVNSAAFCCEAKHLFRKLTGKNTKAVVQDLFEKLKEAQGDLRIYETRGLALCFVVPWFNVRQPREVLGQWIEAVRQRPYWQALVWVGISDNVPWGNVSQRWQEHEDTDCYPGLLLIVSEVPTPRRKRTRQS